MSDEADVCAGCALPLGTPTGETSAHWDTPTGARLVAWSHGGHCAQLVEARRDAAGRLA